VPHFGAPVVRSGLAAAPPCDAFPSTPTSGGDLTGVAVDSNGDVRVGSGLGSTLLAGLGGAAALADGSVPLGTGNGIRVRWSVTSTLAMAAAARGGGTATSSRGRSGNRSASRARRGGWRAAGGDARGREDRSRLRPVKEKPATGPEGLRVDAGRRRSFDSDSTPHRARHDGVRRLHRQGWSPALPGGAPWSRLAPRREAIAVPRGEGRRGLRHRQQVPGRSRLEAQQASPQPAATAGEAGQGRVMRFAGRRVARMMDDMIRTIVP
jgi:hypothetical protein